MPDPETKALARMFAHLWAAFRDGDGIDGAEVYELMKDGPFTETRPCTAEEAEHSDCDEGDDMTFLNDAGRRLITLAEEASDAG